MLNSLPFQSLTKAEENADPQLKSLMEKIGAEEFIPIFALKKINLKQLSYMQDRELMEVRQIDDEIRNGSKSFFLSDGHPQHLHAAEDSVGGGGDGGGRRAVSTSRGGGRGGGDGRGASGFSGFSSAEFRLAEAAAAAAAAANI